MSDFLGGLVDRMFGTASLVQPFIGPRSAAVETALPEEQTEAWPERTSSRSARPSLAEPGQRTQAPSQLDLSSPAKLAYSARPERVDQNENELSPVRPEGVSQNEKELFPVRPERSPAGAKSKDAPFAGAQGERSFSNHFVSVPRQPLAETAVETKE